MKVLYCNPSFWEYRLPFYVELNRLFKGDFHVVYSAKRFGHGHIKLLNRKKEGENIITLSYEKQIRKSEFKNLRYYYFDMQNECKYDNYDRIEYLMQQVNNVLNIFQFFLKFLS